MDQLVEKSSDCGLECFECDFYCGKFLYLTVNFTRSHGIATGANFCIVGRDFAGLSQPDFPKMD